MAASKLVKGISTALLSVVIVWLVTEVLLYFFVFTENSIYLNISYFLTREGNISEYVSQPYSNYINNPDLNDDNWRNNNNIGLRLGREVEIEKPDSVFRVLFLGGSTTYGTLVKDTDSYPSLIGEKIQKMLPDTHISYKRIECLNGGMGAATSAEILTHYLFRYQYLKPDLIVLNGGINDCGAYAIAHNSAYHPDYHHWRIPVENIKQPGKVLKTLMKSRIVSYIVLRTMYSEYFTMDFYDNSFMKFNNSYQWFKYGNDSMYAERFNGFYNNLNSLVQVAHSKKQKVLFVTEVIDTLTMPKEFIKLYTKGLEVNNAFARKLSDDNITSFCGLDNKEFSTEYFVQDDIDGIHLNEKGEELKAERIIPVILEAMKGNYPHRTEYYR